MDQPELAAWLRLLLTPGVGNSTARRLLAAFGLPEQIFTQSQTALASVLGPVQAQALGQEPPQWTTLLEQTWRWLQDGAGSHRILSIADPLYPQSLLATEDPPPLLYAIGAPTVWQRNQLNATGPRCLAVVGSRNPTPQGAANAHQLAHELARQGLTIVSGLALGIDGAAHKGALGAASAQDLATIAEVGTGLDRVYPRQHRELAHQIAERGVLLSELALGTAPLPSNFPQRNRIIAGLSRGTLVVEAALQSGSLITARLASEQGREVFAVPGSIHAVQSRGCHALIKQGAKLVECAGDILDELNWDLGTRPDPATEQDPASTREPAHAPGSALSTAAAPPVPEAALLHALGHEPCGIDELQARTGLAAAALLAQLMDLELQGVVVRLAGGLYQRLWRA